MPVDPDVLDGSPVLGSSDIVVEDGSIVEDANSYVSIEDAKACALLRGVDLSAVSDEQMAVYLILANDYLESFRDEYKGYLTSSIQELQWPRLSVYIDANLISSDSIPQHLINAQCQLVIDQFNGITLQPNRTDKFTIVQQVGDIRREFSEKIGTSSLPKLTAFERFIAPLLKNNSGSGFAYRG